MADNPLPEQKPTPVDPIVDCIVFDAAGRIRQSSACARSLLDAHAAQFGDGFTAMEVPGVQFHRDIDAKAYVHDGKIVPKEIALDVSDFTIKANGSDQLSLELPAGTSVVYAGEIVPIEDGLFEFTTDVLGEHRFSFIPPARFFSFEVIIHAV